MKPIEAHSTATIKAKVTREQQAAHELGNTEFAPGTRITLVVLFLAIILSVPVFQFVAAIRSPERVTRFTTGLTNLAPGWDRIKSVNGVIGAVDLLPPASKIKDLEDDWEENSVVGETLLPQIQSWLIALGQGNEKAYVGRDGWLFFRPDVDSVTIRGFLEPDVMKRRMTTGSGIESPPQPNPIKAIVDFRDQLAQRGITLIVMPAPVKPSIHPEFYSAHYSGKEPPLQNPSFSKFKELLAKESVTVFDPADLLIEAKAAAPETPLYLKTDTHWTPAAMEMTAQKLAEFARRTVNLSPSLKGRFTAIPKPLEALGDVAKMLKLPRGQTTFPPQSVQLRQVLDGEPFWRPDPKAEVLFLGDSFANIYSLETMGWGESAGFVEHLSLALGLPVDAICRNDHGSHITRQELSGELKRGNDRLAGKKLVVWEFASRELAWGDWKLLPLVLGEKKETGFYVPPAGRSVRVSGKVRAVSPVPHWGSPSVNYNDHIFWIHLTDLESAEEGLAKGKEAVVFLWSMRDRINTPISRCRPGDTVRLRICPWADVVAKFGRTTRNELEDDLLSVDPNWGELEP